MERGDVARLFNVADADVRHYVENDETVSVVLTNDVARLWTPDGVFALNDCPQNRQFRSLPDEWKAQGGVVSADVIRLVAEDGPELVDLPEGQIDEASDLQGGDDPDDEALDDGVPDGTADQVLAWVDGDPERAGRAIEAEEQREKPRSTLLANLRKVADS